MGHYLVLLATKDDKCIVDTKAPFDIFLADLLYSEHGSLIRQTGIGSSSTGKHVRLTLTVHVSMSFLPPCGPTGVLDRGRVGFSGWCLVSA